MPALYSYHILVAGFPCQPFSTAGHQRGFNDPRAKELMASLVQRVAKERPWVVLLENVEGLLQSNAGRDLNFIRAAFASCQYLVKVGPTDARQWGLPFMRTRVFIVAVRAEIAERLDWDSYVVPTCPLTGPRSSFPSFHDFLCPEDHDPYDDGAVGLDPSAVTWVRDGRGELLRDTVKSSTTGDRQPA